MIRIRTTQFIDFWAGVPLCFLATQFLRITGQNRKGATQTSRKILFIELSEMGSTILADPAMSLLKKQVGAEIFFVIFAHNKPSLELLNTVPPGNVFTIRATSLSALIIDTLRFLFWSRKQKIDSVVDLELFSRFTALLSGFCGAKRRVGFYAFHNEGLYRGEMLTHRVAYNPHIHVSKNFLALAHSLLLNDQSHPQGKLAIQDSEIKIPRLHFSNHQLEAMQEKVKALASKFNAQKHRIVLINPNASDFLPLRRWMPDRFESVIQMLLNAHEDIFVLITGAPHEKPESDLICRKINSDRCINFAGRTSFAELPLLYSISELMLTNDSGPAHFAAVTSMPTYVIFGPETPKLYGSLGITFPITANFACSPCVAATNHRRSPCTDNQCLKAIQPIEVFALIDQQLKKGKRS